LILQQSTLFNLTRFFSKKPKYNKCDNKGRINTFQLGVVILADQRRIRKIIKSMPTVEGAGVHLKRAFGFHHVPELDPFLLLDEFHSGNPKDYEDGFPWHPHRGIETITYVLEGEIRHEDSMGNKGMIVPGDVQWMTAGSGIIHQEMPVGDEKGHLWGFQLWANLPASHKMMNPDIRKSKAAKYLNF